MGDAAGLGATGVAFAGDAFFFVAGAAGFPVALTVFAPDAADAFFDADDAGADVAFFFGAGDAFGRFALSGEDRFSEEEREAMGAPQPRRTGAAV